MATCYDCGRNECECRPLHESLKAAVREVLDERDAERVELRRLLNAPDTGLYGLGLVDAVRNLLGERKALRRRVRALVETGRRELADATRDDVDDSFEPMAVERRALDQVLSARLPGDVAAALRNHAANLGQSTSDAMRGAVLDLLNSVPSNCPVSEGTASDA